MSDGRNLLTNSRMTCAKVCLRKHYYNYELGIRREQTSQPLRFGSNFHIGLDLLAQKKPLSTVIETIRANYRNVPAWVSGPDMLEDWQVECETCVRLLCGYVWRWQESDLEIVATEQAFNLPLVNPRTGHSSKLFRMAGVIDKIGKTNRLCVVEHKTTSDDLSDDSDYWRRLRLDQQISLYVIAARELGHNVEAVLYDVIRKPSIKPKKITQADTYLFLSNQEYCGEQFNVTMNDAGIRVNGEQVQVEIGGKKQAMRETPAMYGARLNADIAERPNWYFARKEIARLEIDLDEFRAELWQTQEMLRNCQRNGHWFRNTNACLAPYRCEYTDICFSGIDPATNLPDGFVKLEYVHPELERTVP